MKISDIEALARILREQDLSVLDVQEGEAHVHMERSVPPPTAPMVGVFYDRPSENAMPFVSIGSKVKKGDVLCIIEAMKLMNEITAECDGEVVDICLENGQVVEFGQTLFKLF